MKAINKKLGLFTLLALAALPASAASNNASQAAEHSALASAHTSVAATKVASGVLATPLLIVGEAGKLSGKAGGKLMDYALEYEPLEISDEVIIADPAPRQMRVSNTEGGI